jgi:hypothetical protein
MGGLRAKDADRERYVSLIEAAYVDGQLGDEDRELRVSRALGAETLDELEALTRDLQRDPAPAPAAPRVWRSRLIASAAALSIGGVFVTLAILTWPHEPDVDPAPAVVAEAPEPTSSPTTEPEPEPVVEEPEVVPFEMTAAQVRKFLRRYEAKFGTLDTYDASFYPNDVYVEVPVRGSRPRYERWSWNGTWERTSKPSSASMSGPVLDLGTIGVDRLISNIAMAKRTLDVQRGSFGHASFKIWGNDPPAINIYIDNKFQEGGFLKTTPCGDRVLVRYPYEG